MRYFYSLYHLRVVSDEPIPGIPMAPESVAPADVTIAFAQALPDSLHDLSESGWRAHPRYVNRRAHDEPTQPGLRIFASPDNAYIRLHYADDAIFTVRVDGGAIYVQPPANMSRESLCAYLLNPVLALCVRLRGGTCLHASAVGVAGEALLFVAPSGSGKSTLAYEFARQGSTILSDDVSVLTESADGRLCVAPAYPHLRLWSWTVEELHGSADALPLIAPDWDKRYVDLDDVRYDFASAPLPVRAVFLLEGFSSAISIVTVTPTAALMSLMGNTYLNYMLDSIMRADDFRWLSRLTTTVPVYSLVRPADMTRVDACADAILDHLALPTYATGR